MNSKASRIGVLVLLSLFWATSVTAQAKSSSKKSALVVHQSNSWGKYVICATDDAIKIDGPSGGALIARAPDWRVWVFNKPDNKIRMIPLIHFIKNSPGRVALDKLKRVPKETTFLGTPALAYRFPVYGYRDTSAGSGLLYRSKTKRQYVKRRVYTYDKSKSRIPRQACLVWNCFLEFPITGRIPFQYYDLLKDGTKRISLNSSKNFRKSVSTKIFAIPTGLKQRNKEPFLSIFFGNQLEDAAQMLFSD